MIELQYDLFKIIPDETEILRLEIAAVKLSQDKQRKALFAKDNAKAKEIIAMMEEVHRLKFEVEALRKMIAST